LSAKNDGKHFFSTITDENSMVVHLAANKNFKRILDNQILDWVKKKYKIPSKKKYLFSLCTVEPRKNLIRAVRCFLEFISKHNISDLVWVMGGGHWDYFINELKKNNVRWDSNFIIQAGYIDDEDLPVLYSNAEWFVYTSQYEGFGLPPLEAMQCGCPVITSNNSSLPEVVGDAGMMIDWDSDDQHIEAYEKYYFDENLRKEFSKKGLERAKLFSWEKTVDVIVGMMKTRV
jgi:glycosyltransferase involved in cell wall biosynthesis